MYRSPKSFTGGLCNTTQPKVLHQVHIAATQHKQARQGHAFGPAASKTLELSAAVVDADTKECTASVPPSARKIAEVLGQVLICECKTLQPEVRPLTLLRQRLLQLDAPCIASCTPYAFVHVCKLLLYALARIPCCFPCITGIHQLLNSADTLRSSPAKPQGSCAEPGTAVQALRQRCCAA